MSLGNLDSLAYAYGEITLACGVVGLLLAELCLGPRKILGDLALWIIVIAALFTGSLALGGYQGTLFDSMVAIDSFGAFFKLLFCFAAAGAVWMSMGSRELEGEHPGEYYSILLACTLGMFYMASATNLLMAYLAFEFVSQTSYILSGFLRRRVRSSEAALKYLIYGGVASGVMVYGMSLLYGLTGSLDFSAVGAGLRANDGGGLAFAALLMVLAGFGYKIAMVPMHMWSPDVYEGAPLPVTAYLAVGSKAAGFALLIRFFYPGLSMTSGDGTWTAAVSMDWPALLTAISMVTMTLGNLAALRQTNIKRLLAYSSIAHAGYLLMGFVVLTDNGLAAVAFYLVVYYLMNLGAFVVLLMVLNNSGSEELEGFRGLAWRGGALPAAAMAIFMFSLAGLPPFAGFIGKMYLFSAVIEKQMWLYALVAAANSVVALYYYARIARTMYMDFPVAGDPEMTMDVHNATLAGFLALATVVLGVYWAPVAEVARRSMVFFAG